jgi:hypothetical protein
MCSFYPLLTFNYFTVHKKHNKKLGVLFLTYVSPSRPLYVCMYVCLPNNKKY